MDKNSDSYQKQYGNLDSQTDYRSIQRFRRGWEEVHADILSLPQKFQDGYRLSFGKVFR